MNHRLLRPALVAAALLCTERIGAQELNPIAVLRPSSEYKSTRFATYLQVHENALVVSGLGVNLFTRISADGRQWSPDAEYYLGGGEVDLDDELLMINQSLWSRTSGPQGERVHIATLSPSEQAAHAPAEGIALEGDIAVVGAGNNHFQGRQRVGTVSIFKRPSTLASDYTELTIFSPADIAPGDDFGDNLSLDAGVLVASATSHAATGAVYVFERNAGGADAWGQTAKLMPSVVTAPRSFGSDVELEGDQLIVGAGKGV